MNFSSTLKTARNVITANSPALLVGTAIAGVVTTAILAAKGGYKARGIIDEAEEERGSELNTQEKIQLTWLCYAAPALTGASTIAATIGVHTIHTKRHTALAGLYAVTSNKLDDYQEKAEELLGTKKAQAINDSTAQKSIDRAGPVNDHEVYVLENGTQLCQDELSGRYFMGSVPIIERAINNINRQINDDGDVSLNEFYDHVGLPPIQLGQDLGWSGTKVEAKFGSGTTSDGRPAITFWFQPTPKERYNRH